MEESKKAKDPFAKVSTFATIKKMQTGKSGREMVVTGFSLGGNQFDEIDYLATRQEEVMITVQPSRRGTIYVAQDVRYRITKESAANPFDAISELVHEASSDLRVKLLEWHNRKDEEDESKEFLEWDNVEAKDQILEMLEDAMAEDKYIDAMACLALLHNLSRKTYEEICEEEQQEEEAEEDNSLFDEQGEQEEELGDDVEEED